MSEIDAPLWLRTLDIIIGITMVILGIWVIYGLLDPLVLIGVTVIQILGIILVIWGIWNLIKAIFTKYVTMMYRALLLIAGILLIIFGAVAFTEPFLGQQTVALLVSIGIIIYGVIILVIGLMNTQGSGLARGLSAILGIFLLILGIFFIYNLFAAAAFLYFLLALALLFGGFVRIVFGLSGDYV